MKTLLTALVVFVSVTVFSQTNFRFADSTAQWNVLRTEWGFCNCGWTQTHIFSADGDTVINGNNYQRLICNAQNSFPIYGSRFYIRQDSLLKVYGRVYPDSPEYVIYDFGRQPGDTYPIGLQQGWPPAYQVHVDSVGTVNWNGLRKVQYVSVNAIGPFDDIFVEGIGAVKSYFLYPGVDWSAVDGSNLKLLCFFENGQTLYHDTTFQTCVRDTAWGLGIDQAMYLPVRISPNPANDLISIQAENNFPEQTTFQLFDVTGRMVLQKQLNSKTNRLELNDISKGMYLYSITSGEQELASGKLAVQ